MDRLLIKFPIGKKVSVSVQGIEWFKAWDQTFIVVGKVAQVETFFHILVEWNWGTFRAPIGNVVQDSDAADHLNKLKVGTRVSFELNRLDTGLPQKVVGKVALQPNSSFVQVNSLAHGRFTVTAHRLTIEPKTKPT